MQLDTPLIPATEKLPEITIKVIILSIVLAFLLAISNTYLALKIGILTSASIPAAIISMSVLRFFRNSNVLQNNLVQTAASAGEAIAGGIAYTIPALIIIGYWGHFPYWENFMIALLGGLLGVLFSVPIRRVLMTAPHLYFPEGRAIAVVLKADQQQVLGIKQLVFGGMAGGFLELAQTGFKWITNNFQLWFVKNNTIFGFGGGLSATLIGAGYIIGFRVGASIFLGALLNWGILLPLLSHFHATPITNASTAINSIFSEKIRYIGIGAILLAGFWTFVILAKPFYASLQLSIDGLLKRHSNKNILRTEQDIPINYVLITTILLLIVTYFFLRNFLPTTSISFPYLQFPIEIGCIFYIAVVGFIFAMMCGYFSGLVGVAASPGSAIVISGMLLAAVLLRMVLHFYTDNPTHAQLLNAAAMTIIVGSIVAGIAAIANDNIQDLKVGHILGATPWKQQVMLALGAVIAAAIIPLVMQLLFHVYGIANVMPRPNMDPSQALAAPPAAAMAAITQGIFNHDLPWNMIGLGMAVIVLIIIINYFLGRMKLELSLLGVAIGMYLPLSSSVPLFLGSLMALLSYIANKKKFANDPQLQNLVLQKNILLACGLVAGAALMDVVLAIPMAISGNPNVLNLLPKGFEPFANLLGLLTILLLGYWFYRTATTKKGIH